MKIEKKSKKLEDARQAFKKVMQEKAILKALSPVGAIPVLQNAIVIHEDFAKSDKVCITVQTFDEESFHELLEKELSGIFKEQLGKDCVFSYDADNEFVAIPLYHQVLEPVNKIEKIDIKNETEETKKSEKGIELIPLTKADEQIVYGIVYEPDTVDAQGDEASAEVIKKAAYDYMENSQAFKLMHKGKKIKVTILENYIAPVDFEIEKRKVKKGSWVLVTRVLDKKLWKQIKEGNLTGYSMAGYAKVD